MMDVEPQEQPVAEEASPMDSDQSTVYVNNLPEKLKAEGEAAARLATVMVPCVASAGADPAPSLPQQS